jgi:hypothetical protein
MEESEDFEKIVKFRSSEFAIVDAEVIKAIKHADIPGVDKAIYVSTKVSPDMDVAFRITGVYNDASLAKLVVEPAEANAIPDADMEDPINQQLDENVRDPDRSHGESDVIKKTEAKIKSVGTGPVPKSASRERRNDGDSGKGTSGKDILNAKTPIVKARVAQKGSMGRKGEEAGKMGVKRSQNRSPSRMSTLSGSTLAASYQKSDDPISEFLRKVKSRTITEGYLDQLEHKEEIKSSLIKLRTMWVSGDKMSIDSDLLHESIKVLEKHWNKSAEDRVKSIEEMLSRGLQNYIVG